MQVSLAEQVERLKASGFPSHMLLAVGESLSRKLNKPPGKSCCPEKNARKKVEVIPYFHRTSHGLKKVAQRFGVTMVFSAPRKLSGLCSQITGGHRKGDPCKTNHQTKFTSCAVGVVYSVPLSCGKIYIGQTGGCINERLRQHRATLSSGTGSNLALHTKSCQDCVPKFHHAVTVGRGKSRRERELLEAFFIRKNKKTCVSVPSVVLTDKEFHFLAV